MATKKARPGLPTQEVYQFTIEESAVLDVVLGHVLTPIADSLIDMPTWFLSRPEALVLIGLCGYEEEAFWALWLDSKCPAL